MILRRAYANACVGFGLAVVTLSLAASPAAAVAEKPRPDALWNAFPLEPKRERLPAPLLPPAQERSEATTVVDRESASSRSNLVFLVLGSGVLLAFLAGVGVLTGRLLHTRTRAPGPSEPLWQGVALPRPSESTRELQAPQAPAGALRLVAERREAERHPDVIAPRYRWADEASSRRTRSSLAMEIRRLPRRVRDAVWTEDTAPAIVGGAVAVVAAFVLVYLIG